MSKSVNAGVIAGLAGGVIIWIYEAVVWVGVQHQLTLAGIPANAVGLVFGKPAQASLGGLAYVLGAAMHFGFAALWGIGFALAWPYFRRRGVEATLLAIGYAAVAWIAMHLAIAILSDSHPDYADPVVILGGFVSHLFFTVPLALIVKARLAE